jgi:hypothetical protein
MLTWFKLSPRDTLQCDYIKGVTILTFHPIQLIVPIGCFASTWHKMETVT